MTSRGWSRCLGGLLGSLWISLVWGAEIVDRPGVGAKSYVETFDVWQEVDTSAGLTPYLDEATVFNGALEQISYLGISSSVPFDLYEEYPGLYTYDESKIVFENGQAHLRPDPLWPSVLATWRFEEAAWDGTAGEVSDSAGVASGSIAGQAQTTPGQIGRAASFDGQGDAVVLGQGGGLALDPTQEFTLSAWFRTGGDGALISKADSNFGARQFYLFVAGGSLWGAVGGSQHQGLSGGVSDGQWHHGVLVNRLEDGVMRFTLYVDGVADGTFDSGTASNGADVLLGARRDSGNHGLAFELNGELDEVAILDRGLNASEVQDLYAGGAGRALSAYPSDGPSITANFGPRLFGVGEIRSFEAVPSAAHSGDLGFQVSIDGESWQAWNGSSWQVVTDNTSNDASTFEANLPALDVTGGTYLLMRTFLLSDGNQPAGIDVLRWSMDVDPVFEAREILGPITADLAFESLQADITITDHRYDLRLRLLGEDAETPVDEGLLPGNLSGFYEEDLAAPGVDLSSLPGGSYYVEAIFENPFGRYGDSARLESFQVDYQESLGMSEIAVQLSGGIEPVRGGEPVSLTVQVQNPSAASLAEPSLDLTLPAGLSLSAWTAPGDWTCNGLQCTALALDAEATASFEAVLQVESVQESQAVTVLATVDALNDSEAGNNSAQLQLAIDPAVQPRLQIVHRAEPADGTDVTYSVLEGPSLVLDDAVPDDGDGFGSQGEVFLDPDRVYTVDPSLPVGWLLDDVQCSAPPLSATFQEAFTSDSALIYDPVAIEISGGLAQLRQDPLADHLLAQWRFEEASWDGTPGEVVDSSGQGLSGGALGNATTLADGLLGGAATFDGQGDAVQLGQPSALDLHPTQPYSVSLWFRTQGNGALIAKADGNFNQRQFYLFVIDDRLWGTVGGSQHSGSSTGVSDGQWHHAVLVNGGGGGSTFTLFLDGQPDGTFPSGTSTNGLDVLLGARRNQGNSGLAFQLDGELDEVTLLDRALSPEEVQSLYANGSGRLVGGFPSQGPSVDVTLSPVDSGWTAFTGFQDELGLANEGLVTYQLSTDGSTWLWFDGGAWSAVQGGDSAAQSHDASTLDAHIGLLSYDSNQGPLRVRAFLQSDGSQAVELDRLRVLYDSDGLGGVSALNGARIDTAVSPDVSCEFSWVVDPNRFGSLTVVHSADPVDGTDFAYTANVGGQSESFFLDVGNDMDGVASSRSWTEVDPGPVTVSLAGSEPGWYLDSIACEDPVGSVFVTPFDVAESYTYDASIEVAEGVARLQSDALASDLLGYWRMDEDSWGSAPVADSSGLGLDASALGQAETVEGHLGRAGSFDGAGDAVLIGQPSSLDLAPDLDAFTVSAWFRAGGDGAIVGKAEDAFGGRQIYLFIAGGQVHANVGGVQNAGSGSFADNQWHHVALVNTTSGGSPEHHLYVDGVLRGTFSSGSATNGADWMIGARRQSGNVGTAFELNGEVDEVAIFDRALDSDEVGGLYANGDGRAIGGYASDGPSIVKTVGDSAQNLRLRSFTAFGDTANLAFQLSTDGASWRYWDGSAWQVATEPTHRNGATTINAHIGQLDTLSGAIFVRSFLLSDGTQAVSLDEIQVGYDQLSGVSTEVDYYDGNISMDLQGGQNVLCTFHHVLEVNPNGRLSIVLGSNKPEVFASSLTHPDGTVDTFNLNTWPNQNSEYTADQLFAGTYEVFSELPAGWERTELECGSGPVGDQRFYVDYGITNNFDFDSGKIEITGGLSRLKADTLWPDLLAYWHLDAETWGGAPDEVVDASGNGHHGMALGGAGTVEGLVGRAGDFDGSTGLVSFGRPAELDLQPGSDAFTVSAWFRTTGDGAIVGKAGGSLAQRQFYLFVLDGKLWSIVGGELNMSTGFSVADGDWHHAVLVNYLADDGTMRHSLHLDGKRSGDFASGNGTNDADVLLGARRADDFNGGVAFQLDGQVDEVMILGRALDSDEIEILAGEEGRHRTPYPADAPAIIQRNYMTGDVKEFIYHSESLGTNHAGQVAYQVDLGDGVWRFYDGVGLVPAGSNEDRNSLLDLRRGLQTLQPLSIQFRLKALLISDGTQPVELNYVVLDYHHNIGPEVVVQGETLLVTLEPGEQASCYLFNETSLDFSSLTLRVDSVEADGTNYNFEINAASYNLDDAVPDDGDAYGDSLVFEFEGSRTFEIDVFGRSETGLRTLQCSGNGTPFEYSPNTRRLDLEVASGEQVICDFSFERWYQRTVSSEAITDTVYSANNFGAGSGGERLMTVAADDLSGDNPELDPEVFAYDRTANQWQRLTDNPMASTGRPDVSANDRWGVVPMTGDLTGLNPDGNGEIFRFDLVEQTLLQVTDTLSCDNREPTVSDDGTKVAYVNDCRFEGGTQQIVVADGTIEVPLPQGLDCSSRVPKITADGSLVTFVSNCDWLGLNPDQSDEIFQWRWQDGPSAVEQWTNVDATLGGYVSSHQVSDDGRYLLVWANDVLDPDDPIVPTELDLYPIVLRFDRLTGERLVFFPEETAIPLVIGDVLVHSILPLAMDGSGQHFVFHGYDYFEDPETPKWYWCEITEAGDRICNRFAAGDTVQVSPLGVYGLAHIAWEGVGNPAVYLLSPLDLDGSNSDGSEEIWRLTFE